MNDPELALRAEIIREKGADRSRFFRGEVDKYTWQEMGSSFLPGEFIAAFLWAQLNEADSISLLRLACWQRYHDLLKPLEDNGFLLRPIVPEHCQHNAHMYYVLLSPKINRQKVLTEFKKNNIGAVFHYVPLHSSPGGQKFGRACGDLIVTNRVSQQLIRLPLWIGLTEGQQEKVDEVLSNAIVSSNSR